MIHPLVYALHKQCCNKIFYCLLCITTCSLTSSLFKSLSIIDNYASSCPEFPYIKHDGNNEEKYLAAFYESLKPNIFDRVLSMGQGLWNAQEFEKLLSQVIEARQKIGYKEPCVSVLKPTANTQFIIFTELCSSLHTLVRALKHLKELNIIDEELELKDKTVYLVFNGNTFFSPVYSLGTFSVVLRLMYMNPTNIIYIHENGQNEEKGMRQSLALELSIRIKKQKNDQQFPLENSLKQFFGTASRALYLLTDSSESCVEFMRISGSRQGPSMLSDKNLGNILHEPSLAVLFNYPLPEMKPETCARAIITKMDNKEEAASATALSAELEQNSLITWKTLTSFYGCKHSLNACLKASFIILTTGQRLKDWTLKLFSYQHSTKNFIPMRSVNLLTGAELPWLEKTEYDIKSTGQKLKQLQEQFEIAKNDLAEVELTIKAMEIDTKKESDKTQGKNGTK